MLNPLHHPRKRFGQHFLKDPQTLHDIFLALGIQAADKLVEIGPGQGSLTALLVATAAEIDAIEIDRDCVALLKQLFSADKNLTLHAADVLHFDFFKLKTDARLLRVIGNLPYNISTPLLFKLFADLPVIQDMHFMLQKEVVLRLIAPVGASAYGRLSVMTQYFCEPHLLFTVPPTAFTPPPRVASAFVRLLPRPHRSHDPHFQAHLSCVVKEAFLYRRKTLSNALKRLITAQQLVTLGLNPTARPQQLTVEDFVKISHFVNTHRG